MLETSHRKVVKLVNEPSKSEGKHRVPTLLFHVRSKEVRREKGRGGGKRVSVNQTKVEKNTSRTKKNWLILGKTTTR